MKSFLINGDVLKISAPRRGGSKGQFISVQVAIGTSYEIGPDKEGKEREALKVELPVNFEGAAACQAANDLGEGDVVEIGVIPWGFYSEKNGAWYAQHRYVKGTLKVVKKAGVKGGMEAVAEEEVATSDRACAGLPF